MNHVNLCFLEQSRMWEEKCSILQEELVNEKDITMALTRALREGDERMVRTV